MIFAIVLIVVGLALFAYGHTNVRLQLRTIGAGLATFGLVSILLPLILG